MYAVVIHDWNEDTSVLAQTISQTLDITLFEANQRILGGSPSILATFADPTHALPLVSKLQQNKIPVFIQDDTELRERTGFLIVKRFDLHETFLHIETHEDQIEQIPYQEIDLLLPATSAISYSENKNTNSHQFNLNKSIGGLLSYQQDNQNQNFTSVEQRKILYLYFSKRHQPAVFDQQGIAWDGLGNYMQISSEQNFNYLLDVLRNLCRRAIYDDRLLKHARQTHLLGPTLKPETHLDLAAAILSRTLRLSFQK